MLTRPTTITLLALLAASPARAGFVIERSFTTPSRARNGFAVILILTPQ